MPADEILDHIKKTSEEEAKAVLDAANKEASELKEEYKSQTDKSVSALQDKLEKEAQGKKRLIIAKMGRQAAQKEFKTKEALIKEAFDMAWESLKDLHGDNYTGFLKRSYEAGKAATGTPCRVFVVRDKDKGLFKGESVEDPPDGYLKKQIAEGGGGFIIQSGDASITVDYTFKGIIARKMDSLRIGAAKKLFAEE